MLIKLEDILVSEWETPPNQYSLIATCYIYLTAIVKNKKKYLVKLFAPAAINLLTEKPIKKIKAFKIKMAKLSILELITFYLGNQTGIKGYKGYFSIQEFQNGYNTSPHAG